MNIKVMTYRAGGKRHVFFVPSAALELAPGYAVSLGAEDLLCAGEVARLRATSVRFRRVCTRALRIAKLFADERGETWPDFARAYAKGVRRFHRTVRAYAKDWE
jgi:hypothetical protein